MTKNIQPGDAEAAGAIAGMQETYGLPPTGFSIGDNVTYRSMFDESENARGVIIEILDSVLGVYCISIHVPGHGRIIKEAFDQELSPF